ncbi:bifunctional 3-demethylubiquinone 3-O-methyltransferase/2-octaprenyl-6-hydroxy phenol methylase [soil metagenome]
MPLLVRTSDRLSRPRNDPRQYDDLVQHWWNPQGPFALLHAIAEGRARLIPRASRPGAVLFDLACGGGLLAPHVADHGYHHIGLDITLSALRQAAAHGVQTVRADVLALPLPDHTADVVVAGEILEHVTDLPGAVAEACRILRPGGRLVIDTLADTALARLLAVHIAERIPGGAPKGIHDPTLFVNRDELRRLAAAHGVPLTLRGLRPSVLGILRLLARRGDRVPLVATRPTAVLFQAYGTKRRKYKEPR